MESSTQRASRILNQLKEKYPDAQTFDLDGQGNHFVSEVEPTKDHPDYDRAVEVIIRSKPHKHLKMTQKYTVLRGNLKLHIDDKILILQTGNTYTVEPGKIHWAESQNEAWAEIYSTPGWTQEDHIEIEKNM